MENQDNATPATTQPAPVDGPKKADGTPKPMSDKALARWTREKELRTKTVDYKAAGAKIETVADHSPKKTGSKARTVWDLYKPGMLVTDLLAAADKVGLKSYAQACINWDVRHDHITLSVPTKAEQAPAPVTQEPAAQ